MGAARAVAVVIGGGPLAPCDTPFDVVIAADSGADAALAAGLVPDLVIGDLDSISRAGLAWVRDRGITVEEHPTDKADTDAALALRHAATLGAASLTLLGPGTTARLDHLLGALIALGDPVLGGIATIAARFGATDAFVVHPGRSVTFERPPGTTFSLLALHGTCRGVHVSGARWPLADATIGPGSTIGISNEALDTPVRAGTASGVLTIVVPEGEP